jgi:hypothetical protein
LSLAPSRKQLLSGLAPSMASQLEHWEYARFPLKTSRS